MQDGELEGFCCWSCSGANDPVDRVRGFVLPEAKNCFEGWITVCKMAHQYEYVSFVLCVYNKMAVHMLSRFHLRHLPPPLTQLPGLFCKITTTDNVGKQCFSGRAHWSAGARCAMIVWPSTSFCGASHCWFGAGTSPTHRSGCGNC
jgi:hypothetical protein